MKNVFRRLCGLCTAVILCAGLFSACDNDDNPEDKRVFSVETKSLAFDAQASVQYITVKAENVSFTADSAEEWIEVTPDVESGTVKVTVAENESEESRTGSVAVKCEGFDNAEVAITQRGQSDNPEEKYFIITPDEDIPADSAGTSVSYTIDTNYDWRATTDEVWIEIDVQDNIVTVVIPKNTDEERNGKIIFVDNETAAELKVINVSQTGIQIWDRSMASRMNYKGNVSFSSLHRAFVYDDIEITDISFNEDGMITSFKREKFNGTIQSFTVDYDAQGRLSKLTLTSSADDAYIIFSYGNHGFYVPTEQFFNTLANTVNCANKAWLPLFIKDLENVKMTDNLSSRNDVELQYVFTGNSGVVKAVYGTGGSDDEFHKLTVSDVYVTSVIYDLGFWGICEDIYTVNPATGNVLKYTSGEVDEAAVDVLMEFNDDRINTLASITSLYDDYVYTYNDYLDLAGCTGDENKTYTYVYDDKNNWTSVDIDGTVTTREVRYY